MAIPTCLLYTGNNSSSLNINDGTIYTIVGAVDVGVDQKSWDEYRGLDGTVAQTNVSEAALIDMTFNLHVQKDSAANLRTAITAVNTNISGITPGTTHLVYDGTTYHLMASPKVGWVEDTAFLSEFWTVVTLDLKRNSVVA